MKIPNKFIINNKEDNFKEQIAKKINNLIDCIIELKEENNQLKKEIDKRNTSFPHPR